MYAAKVRVQPGAPAEAGPSEPSTPGAGGEDGAIAFSAGNPCVEHITGVVHLFRHVPPGPAAAAAPPAAPSDELPEGHGARVCILTMPGDMGTAELCTFLGGYLPAVREMRLVRREGAAQHRLVFLRLDSPDTAARFFRDYNARPFSSLEPDVQCRLVFIRDLEVLSGEAAEPVRPPTGQTELPSCPVCLERLDQHISGVVTTVCNHRFHSECLRQWADDSCPVCRYCTHSAATTAHCASCGTSQDLWICLICGHVGCGRYRAGHSVDHWRESGHVYALELESQRVWDYVGDGYVHRLIQSKTDGKLVEVPAPSAASGSSGPGPAGACSPEPAGQPLPDAQLQEALFASKVDAFAAEYNHLLVSQLDSQRVYYEGLLRTADAEAARCQAGGRAAAEAAEAAAAAAVAEARASLQVRKVAERRLVEANARMAETRRERDVFKALNDSVMANQAAFRERLAAAEAAAQARAARVAELEEQVRDLMIFIEARQAIAGEGERELQGGSASAPPPPARRRSSGARRK